jgi:hypothetical protein
VDNETIGATCRCNCPSGIRSCSISRPPGRSVSTFRTNVLALVDEAIEQRVVVLRFATRRLDSCRLGVTLGRSLWSSRPLISRHSSRQSSRRTRAGARRRIAFAFWKKSHLVGSRLRTAEPETLREGRWSEGRSVRWASAGCGEIGPPRGWRERQAVSLRVAASGLRLSQDCALQGQRQPDRSGQLRLRRAIRFRRRRRTAALGQGEL